MDKKKEKQWTDNLENKLHEFFKTILDSALSTESSAEEKI